MALKRKKRAKLVCFIEHKKYFAFLKPANLVQFLPLCKDGFSLDFKHYSRVELKDSDKRTSLPYSDKLYNGKKSFKVETPRVKKICYFF
jgi:hypothetical protein